MSETEYAHIMEDQEITDAWQKEEFEAHQLPAIDLNAINPSGEIIRMQFGDKMEIFSTTSSDIANKIIENILEGFTDVKSFLVKKKLIIDALDLVMKNEGVKNHAISEVENLKGDRVLGAKVSLTNRADYKYEFDPKCKEILDQIKPLEEKLKAQKEMVKIACKTNKSLIDEAGEVHAQVVPAPQSTSIMVSFSKK